MPYGFAVLYIHPDVPHCTPILRCPPAGELSLAQKTVPIQGERTSRSGRSAFGETLRAKSATPSATEEQTARRTNQNSSKAVWNKKCDVDVRSLRTRLGLSQEDFARRFRLSVGAIREWEQGRRCPDLAASTLLKVIQHNPQAVMDALASSREGSL